MRQPDGDYKEESADLNRAQSDRKPGGLLHADRCYEADGHQKAYRSSTRIDIDEEADIAREPD